MSAVNKGRCWAEIDLSALRRNAAVAVSCVGAGTELMAVIKADGYGHGMTRVGEALAYVAQLFGVANLEEATLLRKVVRQPIILLGPALPEERHEIAECGFIPSISSFAEAKEYDRCAKVPLSFNYIIDTGMGRMGVEEVKAAEELEKIASLKQMKLHSVSTHLPVADEDAGFTNEQLARFSELVRQIRAKITEPFKVHVLLSAGILGFRREPFDIIRAGLMLYGISPLPEFQKLLEPVMSLKTRIVLLRDLPKGRSVSYGRTFVSQKQMRVATLSVGYADGYPRSLSNRDAAVLIGGQHCPVLGRVTMDLTMVDVTDVAGVQVGDEVILIGREDGEVILASEVAERAGTIAWEIFTGIGSRVHRVYL